MRASLLSGAAELTTHVSRLINILLLPLCRINKFKLYFPRRLLRSPILVGHHPPRCWFIVDPLNIESYSLCYDTWFVRDSIYSISILLFNLLTDKHINSIPFHHISPCPSHMLASLMDLIIIEWAQSINPLFGCEILILIHTPQPILIGNT